MRERMEFRPDTRDALTIGEIAAYKHLRIAPGDIVMDMGGNIGSFGVDALNRGAERVIAYEPEPDNARMYEKNVHPGKRLLYFAAVANEYGTGQLHIRTSTSHSMYQSERSSGSIEVDTVSFRHEIYKHRPRVLKVDIEGNEYIVDWSDLGTVEELAVEFHLWKRSGAREKAAEIVRTIESQGFNVIRPLEYTKMYEVGIWTKGDPGEPFRRRGYSRREPEIVVIPTSSWFTTKTFTVRVFRFKRLMPRIRWDR